LGLIIFTSKNGSKNGYHKEVEKYQYINENLLVLNVTDWRVIVSTPDEERGLQVFLDNNKKFEIEDMDEEELHEINYCNKIVHKVFYLTNHFLFCASCGGAGKIDWINKITKREYKYSCPFYRDPKGYVITLSSERSSNKGEVIEVSNPKLVKGEEICPDCYGSGLNFVRNYHFLKKRIIEYC